MSTLEQELKRRIHMHKLGIVGGSLMNEYINKAIAENNIAPTLEAEAQLYSDKVIEKLLEANLFNAVYNYTWNDLQYVLPDDLIISA